MKNFEKYINTETKDFSKIRELLSEDRVKKISFKNNWTLESHNELLIEFFKIDKKNEIIKLEDIFDNSTKEYAFYTTFPLKHILEDEKIEILLPYVKEYKYFREMIRPLQDSIKDKYSPYIHLHSSRDKMSLTIYNYIDTNNKKLKIIQADHISKNPIYGLLHYINLDSYLFGRKSLVLQKLKIVSVNKDYFKTFQKFFKNIGVNGYKFKLEVKESSNTKNKALDLFFYNENKDIYKNILSFENFDIEFLITFFESFYSLDTILEQIDNMDIKLRFYFYEQDNIKLQIQNEQIAIEKDIALLSNLLRSIFQEHEFGIISFFKFHFSNKYYIDEIVTKENYYNFKRKKYILYKIKEIMK